MEPAGRGGGGKNAQLALGISRIGPLVVCAIVVAAAYVQSQAMILPGAVDVLPLNVHSRLLPPFVITHVSDESVP